jgi:hypothetical protein
LVDGDVAGATRLAISGDLASPRRRVASAFALWKLAEMLRKNVIVTMTIENGRTWRAGLQ